MKIRSLIVEDEKHCADRLRYLLDKDHSGKFEIPGWEKTLDGALSFIKTYKPDLVFLDIEIKNENAFDLLRQLDKIDFNVIFTTAHKEYALSAIKFSALDYLLKPVLQDELAAAIRKHQENLFNTSINERFKLLFENLEDRKNGRKRISIPTLHGLEFIQVSDIIRCQSNINYTHLYLKDKRKLTVSKTLKEFDELLTPCGFFRTHNSHLINLEEVVSYHKGKGGYIILKDRSEIEVSTRRKEELVRILKGS